MNRTAAVIGLVAVTAFAIGIGAGVLRHRVSTALVYPTPRLLPPADLIDHRGEPLTRERFLGGWDILFFGFTHCPDICPTTLYELSQLRKRLGNLKPGRQPRIWLVSVDPERDTPQELARYLSNFDDAFSGITGTPDQIAQFAAGLAVAYQRVPVGDDYTIAHTAALFLIDPDANAVALFSAPHDMTAIAADYRALTR